LAMPEFTLDIANIVHNEREREMKKAEYEKREREEKG
jgi:hypothetical protein